MGGNIFTFSKTRILALPVPDRLTTYRDDKTPGLVLLVTPNGIKTFYLRRRIGGRDERIKLGIFPALTVEQARQKAAMVHGEIEAGANPAAAKRKAKTEPTFGEVFKSFLQGKRTKDGRPLSDRTRDDYRQCVNLHLSGLWNNRLSQITEERLRALHRRIESHAQANRAKAIVSVVFNHARRERISTVENPATWLQGRHIPSRDRFLQAHELPQFFEAASESPLRDFFLLALLTGARKSNLQAMRWQDVDLEGGIWRIPATKNGTPQNVALVPEAVEILRARRAVGETYVFPGNGKTGHLVEPKKAFAAILKKAGIEGVRIHDLRRTLGSWQAKTGASLTIIGKSLNHKTHQATQIYARLDLDPVRQSVNTATSAMLEAAGVKPSADVVPLRRKAK